jgi:signal transduction histidine kinase
MSFLQDIVELISSQPGDLVYHLISLFAVQIIVTLALGHWRHNHRDPLAVQLGVLGGALFLTRMPLMGIALLARVGTLSPQVIQPPLERFLDLVTLLLAAWAFLPILSRHLRLSTMGLVVSLLISAGIYVAFAALWPQDEALSVVYIGYWQDTVWEFLSIAVTGLALIASVVRREGRWGLVACLFGIWLVGHVLQFAAPLSVEAHTAGWVRLANLATLPVIASLVYHRVLRASPAMIMRRDAGPEIISILGAIQRIETAHDIEAALRLAAPSIAHAVGADMVAIGVPAPGSTKQLRIVALHPSTGTMLAAQEPTLLLSRHPLLATAIKTGSMQFANAPIKDPTIISLYHRLGFERPGPLLALPLISEDALLGVILTGNSVSQQNWTMRGKQIFQAMGAALTTALVNSSRLRDSERSGELQQAIGKARQLAHQVSELETEIKRQRQRAEELATKLRLREQQENAAESESADEIVFLKEEIRQLLSARITAEAELAKWKEKTEQLLQLNDSLQEQLTQAQVELQETKTPGPAVPPTLHRQIIDSLGPQAILIGDEQGNIILANQGARYLVGQIRTGLEGTPLQSLFVEPAWAEAIDKLLADDLEDSNATSVTLRLDGRRVRAELTRIPNITGGMGTLAVMFYPVEQAPAQDDTVMSLVHELRTPMTSITSYTELLLGESVGILGEMQRQFLQRINANIERMSGLMEDIARVISIDAGDGLLAPEPVELINVIEDAIMSLSPQFSERELGVQMDMPSQLPPIRADRDSLYQIVLHLLSNACHSSVPGTEVLVHARLEQYEEQLHDLPDYLFMSVTDTGGGIAPEDQRRVFQRLYRADNPTIDGLGDTGVGLSIAKTLVETQGGRIWVESEMDVGSTFSFVLPLSPQTSSVYPAGSLPDPVALSDSAPGGEES